MIEKVIVENFKSHAHTEIELGRVTALVGPNGCGKTSLLQAILALNQLVERIISGSWNWNTVLQFVRKGQREDSIRISVIGPKSSWAIKLKGANVTDHLDHTEIAPELFNLMFGRAAYCKTISQEVATPSYTLSIPPKIGFDGNGAASVISNLKASQEEVYESIERDLRHVVPTVKRVRAHRVPKIVKEKRTISANGNNILYDEDRTVDAWELIFDMTSGDRLPASMVSEGTLVTLALLTLLHTSDASIFLLDDIEQGLHPTAQMKLMQTLKDFAEKFDKQIIVTSHSPYIIDSLNAEDVWVLATDKEGVSHCKRLSEGPNAKFALGVLTTGEFLSAEGEDWVLEETSQQELAHV